MSEEKLDKMRTDNRRLKNLNQSRHFENIDLLESNKQLRAALENLVFSFEEHYDFPMHEKSPNGVDAYRKAKALIAPKKCVQCLSLNRRYCTHKKG